jgi:predicted amidohydrolase
MKTQLILTIMALFAFSASSFAGVKNINENFGPVYEKDYSMVKVAGVQWAPAGYAPLTQSKSKAERWKQGNRERLESYIREAARNGAEVVITPEFGIVGYPDIPELSDEDDNFTSRSDIQAFVEYVPNGPSTRFFEDLAAELGIYIHFGLAEVDAATDNYHNTVVVIGPDGKYITKYRKIHLYQVESDYLVPGDEVVTYDGPMGRVGIIICSDVYGSHPMNDYARRNVDVMALSTSWAQWNTGWSYFTRGATWTNSYLIAANQNYFPDSGVINPDGSEQSHIRQTTGVVYGMIPRVGF